VVDVSRKKIAADLYFIREWPISLRNHYASTPLLSTCVPAHENKVARLEGTLLRMNIVRDALSLKRYVDLAVDRRLR
jgi:hypothetical protein